MILKRIILLIYNMIFHPDKICTINKKIRKRKGQTCEFWYKPTPLCKKRKKISNELFVIPELKDYLNLIKVNLIRIK